MIVTFPPLKAMLHGFFDFENFDLDEYEHYEVRTTFLLDQHIDQFDMSFLLLILESGKWRFELDCSSKTISLFWATCQE